MLNLIVIAFLNNSQLFLFLVCFVCFGAALRILQFQKQQIAQIYVLIMQRTLERGISFIGAEQMRLQQLLSGKISDQKRKEINQKLNILSSFHVIGTPEPRTEL